MSAASITKEEIVHYCEDCDVALCVDGCFEAFHTR